MRDNNKAVKVIIILLLIITLSSLAVTIALLMAPKPEYTIILGVDELNSGIKNKDAVLIDLRDEKDYEAGHIDGAINMPYVEESTKMLDYLKEKAGKNYKIYLMCYHGNRSGMAFNFLRDNGYTNLHYVRFGYEDYVNAMGSKFKPLQGECPCKNYG